MLERDHTASDAPDFAVPLRHMIIGFRVTQLIYVAAKLGIADHLRLDPQSIDVLAGISGAPPRSANAKERQEVHAGNLIFAGEHLSDAFYGFMNGAAETGRLAADFVVRRIAELTVASRRESERRVA